MCCGWSGDRHSRAPPKRRRLLTHLQSHPMSRAKHTWVDKWVAFCYRLTMSQPVKVSDALILDARLTSGAAERSIAGQIEFWARLGRAIEPLLRGDEALALSRAGSAKPLSECLGPVDLPAGRRR